MLALYHEWNSVHSFKVRIALVEKELEWVDHAVELLKFEHLRPEYLALNPNGVVPTLVHDGRAVVDSSVICEYLEDVYPTPALRPADPLPRARARNWLKYHDDVAHAALRNASFQLLYKPQLAAMPRDELAARLSLHPDPERRRKFLDGARSDVEWPVLGESLRALRGIAVLNDRELGERSWLVGEMFSLADIAMAPFAERIVNLGMAFLWGGLPRGAVWADRLLSRHSVARACPPERFRLPLPSAEVRQKLERLYSESE